MIVHNSQRVPPCSAREPRSDAISVASDRGELHDALGGHRLIAPETQHEVSQNLTDEFRTVFIGVARHGLGTIVRPFKSRSFHSPEIADGRQ